MTGYSGTPLAKKLGFKLGLKIYVEHAPVDYLHWLVPLPEGVIFVDQARPGLDIAHIFTQQKSVLALALQNYRGLIQRDGAVWVSWPKKAAKVPTDISEDVIRDLALPLGFVDIKVCAVSEVWSGLKLVIRRELRE